MATLADLTDVEPQGLREILLGWGLAEATNPQFAAAFGAFHKRALSGQRIATNAAEEEQLIVALLKVRFPLIWFFMLREAKWSRATIALSDLARVRSMQWSGHPHPGIELGDWARKGNTYGQKIVAPKVAAMAGRPVLVGDGGTDRLTLLDGYNRTTAFLREMDTGGMPASDRVPVYLGVVSGIRDWPFYSP